MWKLIINTAKLRLSEEQNFVHKRMPKDTEKDVILKHVKLSFNVYKI